MCSEHGSGPCDALVRTAAHGTRYHSPSLATASRFSLPRPTCAQRPLPLLRCTASNALPFGPSHCAPVSVRSHLHCALHSRRSCVHFVLLPRVPCDAPRRCTYLSDPLLRRHQSISARTRAHRITVRDRVWTACCPTHLVREARRPVVASSEDAYTSLLPKVKVVCDRHHQCGASRNAS